MYLVLLETSGNQSFIFSTNKLRENLGASELIYRTGTKWLLQAVHDSGGPDLWNEDAVQMRLNLESQPRLIKNDSEAIIEVILATSGKALLLVKTQEIAQKVIRKATHRTLEEAPGVDLCGVYEAIPTEGNELTPFIDSKIGSRIYEYLSTVRAQRPGSQSRFQRLPVVDECATSGLPACYPQALVPEPGSASGNKRQSAVSRAKERVRLEAADRINQLIRDRGWKFATNADQLQRSNPNNASASEQEWVAIVHADGNGLGQIFLEFEKHIKKNATLAEYFQELRKFSIALDRCTEKAFLIALDQTFGDRDWPNNTIPLVPLILGGDDLTVMCAGRWALQFTEAFLKAFEVETLGENQEKKIISPIAESALNCNHLSACAGVAIVKPHFPFSIAYELAEDLITSAKTVKKAVLSKANPSKPYPCSAIDFHILYDSSNVDLEAIRDRLRIGPDGQDQLYSKPYVVTPNDQLTAITPASQAWVNQHRWEQLENRVQALELPDQDGQRLLPNSQAHTLRQSLFMGQATADAQLKLMWPRYKDKPEKGDERKILSQLVHHSGSHQKSDQQSQAETPEFSLFTDFVVPSPPSAPNETPPERLTGFLDAIEAVSFLASKTTPSSTVDSLPEQTLPAS